MEREAGVQRESRQDGDRDQVEGAGAQARRLPDGPLLLSQQQAHCRPPNWADQPTRNYFHSNDRHI